MINVFNRFLLKFLNNPIFLGVILTLFNFFLRRNGLTDNSIALDEPFSIYVAQFDITKIIAYLSTGNNPPLFEIILHYWIKLVGLKVSAVRFLPCLFSALTALYVFKITKRIGTKRSAFCAYLLFTFSNYEGYFAHETRVYSLFALLTCMSFYYFLKIQQDEKKIKTFVIYTLVNILLIYAHFFGFFVLFVQCLTVFIFSSFCHTIKKELSYCLLALIIAYSPYIYIFIERFYTSTSAGTWIAPVTNLGQLHNVFLVLVNNNSIFYVVVLVIFWLIFQKIITKQFSNRWFINSINLLTIFYLFYAFSIVASMPYFWEFSSNPWAMTSYLMVMILGVILIIRSKVIDPFQKTVLLWFSIPLLIMFICSFKIPMFIERYYIFVTPAFFILVALLIDYISSKFNVKFYLFILGFMAITSVRNESNKRDVKPLVEKTKELKTKNTPVIICADYFDMNFTYYYSTKIFKQIGLDPVEEGIKKNLKKERIYAVKNLTQLDTTKLKNSKQILFLDAAADFNYPNNGILIYLKQHYPKIETFDYGDALRLYKFEK